MYHITDYVTQCWECPRESPLKSCWLHSVYRAIMLLDMLLVIILVAFGSLSLVSLTLAELVITSNTIRENYNYIELQCVDNISQTPVVGASFQLNGTEIEQDAQTSVYVFILTQEKEGFFTCSLNGSFSQNAIGLAGY